MFARMIVGAALGAALSVSAHAQSFDGTYKGSVTITKRIGNPGSECPAVGGQLAITVTVSGGGARLTHAFATYRGTVDGTGKVSINGSRPTASGGDHLAARYSGTVRGNRMSGSAVARTSGSECHGTFSARR